MFPLSTDPVRSLRRWAALLGFALFLIVAGSFGLYVHYLQSRVATLETRLSAAEANSAAATAWRKGHEALTEDRETKEDEVEAVLAAHPEWADEPVPDDVADLLREHPRP